MATSQKKKAEENLPAKTSEGSLPAYLANYKGATGTESIDNADVALPRLKLGQSMSKEVKAGDVEEGAIFLNITGQTLAGPQETLEIVPLAQSKEFILWRPRQDNGGGILARARPVQTDQGVMYQWDKQNQSFEVKVMGKTKATWSTKRFIEEDGLGEWGSEIPGDKESKIAATAHYNYVVYLPKYEMVAALSFANTAAKKARDFNAMLKMSTVPMFARKFTVQSVDDHAGGNEFKNFLIKPSGFVQEEALFEHCKGLFEGFRGRAVNVDHSDGPEETDERQ